MSDRGWIILAILVLALSAGGVMVLTRSQFLALVGREVKRQLDELRPDLTEAQRVEAAAIVAAQAAHETGFGSTIAWRQGWNFGNLTAGPSSMWRGAVTLGGDLEYTKDGKIIKITQRFRRYASLGDATSDYLLFLNWPRYRPARDALMRGDAVAFAEKLRNDDPATVQIEGGYYTAPSASYVAAISNYLPDARKAIS